jgi:hypothetical protein
MSPVEISRDEAVTASDSGRHEQISGNETGRQSSGDSETDDPGSSALDRRAEGRAQTRALVANYRYAGTACNARLKRQTCDCNNARRSRHPHPASRRHLSQRLPPRSTPQHAEKPSYRRGFWKSLGMIPAPGREPAKFHAWHDTPASRRYHYSLGGFGDVNEP